MKALVVLCLISSVALSPPLWADLCEQGLEQTSQALTQKAPIIVLSGPSGVGKTTVLHKYLEHTSLPVHTAVAVTTRQPREGELNGQAYHFWTKEAFDAAIKRGDFLEWSEVHGNYYGTLKSEVEPYRNEGTLVVLVIDVQGAEKVRAQYPESVSIFMKTSAPDAVEGRLRGRNTETEEAIRKRLDNAKEELKHERDYTYTVLNDNLEKAVEDFSKILQAAHAKTRTP